MKNFILQTSGETKTVIIWVILSPVHVSKLRYKDNIYMHIQYMHV